MALRIFEAPAYGYAMHLNDSSREVLDKHGIRLDAPGLSFYRVTIRGGKWEPSPDQGPVRGMYSFTSSFPGFDIATRTYLFQVENGTGFITRYSERYLIEPSRYAKYWGYVEDGKGFNAVAAVIDGAPELSYVTQKPSRPLNETHDLKSWKEEDHSPDLLASIL